MPICFVTDSVARPLQRRVIFSQTGLFHPPFVPVRYFFRRKPDCLITRSLTKFFLLPETGLFHSPSVPIRYFFRRKPDCFVTRCPVTFFVSSESDCPATLCHGLFVRTGCSFAEKITTEFSGGRVCPNLH